MRCDKARKLYEDAHDARQKQASADALQHLNACPDCSQWMAGMKAACNALQSRASIPQISVSQAVMARLPERHPASVRAGVARTLGWVPAALGAAALGLFAAVVAAVASSYRLIEDAAGRALVMGARTLATSAVVADSLKPLAKALAEALGVLSSLFASSQAQLTVAAACLIVIVLPLVFQKKGAIKMRSLLCGLSILAALWCGPAGAGLLDDLESGINALGANFLDRHVRVVSAAETEVAAAIPLPAQWKFRTDPGGIGTSKGWYKVAPPAGDWRMIAVPGIWEPQGVNDSQGRQYDGDAWYRTSVVIPKDWRGRGVHLNLGEIDDFDWAWVNGTLVGKTYTPGQAADTIPRSYQVPDSLIRWDKPNVIAVRVKDLRLDGGIARGIVTMSCGAPIASGTRSDKFPEQVRVGGSVTVERGQVTSDAVAVMGSVRVRGEVKGDAVSVLGDIIVEDGGRITGDAVAVGGSVRRSGSGTVDGDIVQVGKWAGFGLPASEGWGRLVAVAGIWSWIQAVVLSLLVVLLFPVRVQVAADAALRRPGASFGYGLLGLLASGAAAGFLVLTCVGIPLAGLLVLAVVAAMILGSAVARAACGSRLYGAFGQGPLSPALAVVIGAALLALVGLIPAVGWFAVVLIDLLGVGAVLLTGFGASDDWLETRKAFRKPAPPAPQPTPPGSP